MYDGVLFNTNEEIDPTEDLIGRRHLSMLDSDIWSHTHRMYLIGENSISFPWYIPKDFPNRALDPENKDKIIRFIKSKQGALDWTELQKDSYIAARVFFPPAASCLHNMFRRRHFKAL